MLLGITGHQRLPDSVLDYVRSSVASELKRNMPGLRGVSCLAAGSDQIFADELVGIGGELVAVVPSLGYEMTFDMPERTHYRELLASAVEVVRLGFPEPTEEAYMAAGAEVVRRCDQLVAVWDGQRSRGLGGTADVVAFARDLGKPVIIVWPDGVRR